MIISQRSHEIFKVGPFMVAVHPDHGGHKITAFWEDSEQWSEPFRGTTLDEAKAQAAQRIIRNCRMIILEAMNLTATKL